MKKLIHKLNKIKRLLYDRFVLYLVVKNIEIQKYNMYNNNNNSNNSLKRGNDI